MVYIILRFLSFLILKVIFRLEVRGREYIPKKGAFILAANHLSYLDPVVLGAACGRKLNFMAKHSLFLNPFFARLLPLLNVFPVKRDSADLFALKEAMRRIKKGGGLLLFPQGRRVEKGAEFDKPHPGIGFLADKLDVTVIPAFVRGTGDALPKGARFIRPGKISVCFGKQVYIKKDLSYQDNAQLVMEEIRHLGQK